jgi:hypothetical protein
MSWAGLRPGADEGLADQARPRVSIREPDRWTGYLVMLALNRLSSVRCPTQNRVWVWPGPGGTTTSARVR